MSYFDRLFSLTGKTALVTGGATGIGRMMAETLAMAGARVLVASRKGQDCESAADEINAIEPKGAAEGFAGDVGSESGVGALVTELQRRTDKLDILVNNAGKTWGAELGSFPFKGWDAVMSVNVAGLFTLTQNLLPMLRESASASDPSRVINLGSIVGSQPMGNRAYSYAASKSAVHHLTRILAQELSAEYITVNALAPGPFRSRMMSFALADDAGIARVAAGVPMGRLGAADDIAGALLFLCGRGGSYTTGAILPIDGGKSVMTGHRFYTDELE